MGLRLDLGLETVVSVLVSVWKVRGLVQQIAGTPAQHISACVRVWHILSSTHLAVVEPARPCRGTVYNGPINTGACRRRRPAPIYLSVLLKS